MPLHIRITSDGRWQFGGYHSD